jgi:hypothetical protein
MMHRDKIFFEFDHQGFYQMKLFRHSVRFTVSRLSSTVRTVIKEIKFPGAPFSKYTENLRIEKDWPAIPTFRILDRNGTLLNELEEPKVRMC